jgi:hypothetical protein
MHPPLMETGRDYFDWVLLSLTAPSVSLASHIKQMMNNTSRQFAWHSGETFRFLPL